MLHVKTILMRGNGVTDAAVEFAPGANVLAGASDTGKSLILHCLDYILGADDFRKRVPEIEPYSTLFVEFENDNAETLTLKRDLSGGELAVYNTPIPQISGAGQTVAPRRYGKSVAPDVTSVLFPFAGIPEAKLRKNNQGDVQRLTVRTFFPVNIVDEISVIDEQSPVLGNDGYDDTARKRMFSFMLSGKDDAGVVAAEKREIVKARLNAQLGVLNDLLAPLEKKLEGHSNDESHDSIEKLDNSINKIHESLEQAENEREEIQRIRQEASDLNDYSRNQIIAIDELLDRYHLLDERYKSDLERLDFVVEGTQFFAELQELTCPLCDQVLHADHLHIAEERSVSIYDAARAEAAKILAQRTDLAAAIDDLEGRRRVQETSRKEATANLLNAEAQLRDHLAPRLKGDSAKLEQLTAKRLELESVRNDFDQFESLRQMKQDIEEASKQPRTKARDWEPLPSKSLLDFCREVEAVLKEWKWKTAEPRVEFDQRTYDIVVDGQARQSHGKGVRAVLYSAFTVALLRYCQKHDRPHLGFVIIDSPLTSYKRGRDGSTARDDIDPGLEAGFWQSLPNADAGTQIIVIENKEPPASVATSTHFEWFAGQDAKDGDRRGFAP